MTLLWMDGFDHYDYDQMIDKGYVHNVSNTYIGSGFARFSGQGIHLLSTSFYFRKDFGVNKSTIYMGIAMNHAEGGMPLLQLTNPQIRFRDEAGTTQVKIHLTPSFEIAAYQGDDTLLGASSDYIIEHYKWFYLEIKITISATVGVVEIKKDGTQILNLTAQDTKNGTDYIRDITLYGGTSTKSIHYDDFYIDDAQFHGDCQVRTFVPDADGNSSDFTRSTGSNDYECVDEEVANDDTDYIYSSTLNHKSIFGITTGDLLSGVKGIQLNNHCRDDAAGSNQVTPIIRSNSTDYSGTETGVIGSDYVFESEIWETDPDDSNVWTKTKLEAAEFGLEITT